MSTNIISSVVKKAEELINSQYVDLGKLPDNVRIPVSKLHNGMDQIKFLKRLSKLLTLGRSEDSRLFDMLSYMDDDSPDIRISSSFYDRFSNLCRINEMYNRGPWVLLKKIESMDSDKLRLISNGKAMSLIDHIK